MRFNSVGLALAFVLYLTAPLVGAADETGDSTEMQDSTISDGAPEADATLDQETTVSPDAWVLGPQVSSKVELTPDDKTEKEARRICKIEICDIIATREPRGEDIACDIKKTWHADSLTKMLGDQISWPWGKAVCKSTLNLNRADLAAAMLETDTTVKMDKFAVACELRTGEGDPYIVEMELAPEVIFNEGKAISATINWGDVSAPLLIYPVIYAGTGFDNRSNILGSSVVSLINEFTHKTCAEVKDELPGRRFN